MQPWYNTFIVSFKLNFTSYSLDIGHNVKHRFFETFNRSYLFLSLRFSRFPYEPVERVFYYPLSPPNESIVLTN